MFPLGLPEIDAALQGRRGGAPAHCLGLIGGTRASGRSSLLRLLALNLAAQGQEVLLIPLDDKPQVVLTAFAAQGASVPQNLTIWDHAPLTPAALRRTLSATPRISVVLIDGADLMQLDEDDPAAARGGSWPGSGKLLKHLSQISREQSVLLLAAANATRNATPGQPLPVGSYFAASGRELQRCDLLFQIWRPDQDRNSAYAGNRPREADVFLRLVKNRYGPEALQPLALDLDSGAMRVSAGLAMEEIGKLAETELVPFQLSRPSGLAERRAQEGASPSTERLTTAARAGTMRA